MRVEVFFVLRICLFCSFSTFCTLHIRGNNVGQYIFYFFSSARWRRRTLSGGPGECAPRGASTRTDVRFLIGFSSKVCNNKIWEIRFSFFEDAETYSFPNWWWERWGEEKVEGGRRREKERGKTHKKRVKRHLFFLAAAYLLFCMGNCLVTLRGEVEM